MPFISIFCLSQQSPPQKFNAMHKLGSSPIGCEDFSTPGGITNGVSDGIGIGSSPIGYEGLVQPQKGQDKAKPNEYYNYFCRLLIYTLFIHLFIYQISFNIPIISPLYPPYLVHPLSSIFILHCFFLRPVSGWYFTSFGFRPLKATKKFRKLSSPRSERSSAKSASKSRPAPVSSGREAMATLHTRATLKPTKYGVFFSVFRVGFKYHKNLHYSKGFRVLICFNRIE